MSKKGEYLICLQALCDTVIRHDASRFIFARLKEIEEVQNEPVFVIPRVGSPSEYLILAIDKRAYTNLVALDFPPNPETQMVSATKTRGRSGFHFFDQEKIAYCWLANAKGRRALRTVHELAHSMSRVGFDEFEPFRAA